MSLEEEITTEPISRPELPTSRVKRIIKLDRDINKLNSEALFLISSSADLFLRFLAHKSAEVASEKKRKTVKLDDIHAAVKQHRSTSDFLLDSLPVPIQTSTKSSSADATRVKTRGVADKGIPRGTRRIDDFFSRPAIGEPIPETGEDPLL